SFDKKIANEPVTMRSPKAWRGSG
ncbi:hypothetical protein VCHC62B1_3263B, partial [Vibrio cholerae HC-62B1]